MMLNLSFHIAAILRFGPNNLRALIGSPLKITTTSANTVIPLRNVVGKGLLCQLD